MTKLKRDGWAVRRLDDKIRSESVHVNLGLKSPRWGAWLGRWRCGFSSGVVESCNLGNVVVEGEKGRPITPGISPELTHRHLKKNRWCAIGE